MRKRKLSASALSPSTHSLAPGSTNTCNSALEALRVLIVKTMGFAAISARPDPSQPGVLSTADLRRNFGNSLTWLLKGIRS